VIRELGEQGLLHKEALTANGQTLWENNKDARNDNPEVITRYAKPFKRHTGIAVLRGNLCPDGAIIKPSAATPKLMKHKGRAVVFEDIDEFHRRVDDPKLEIDATSVMVLKNCGPRGYPGMPEVGNMSIPAKLLKRGITDLVRISDGRMSGTAYGTVVLHVSPEAAAGGPLALVQDGDVIELDVEARRLHLDVNDAELARRRAAWRAPASPVPPGGYASLYIEHVQQADRGCDFDFLVGCRGTPPTRESH
jgi:dihydroxy-acid dehydratase